MGKLLDVQTGWPQLRRRALALEAGNGNVPLLSQHWEAQRGISETWQLATQGKLQVSGPV